MVQDFTAEMDPTDFAKKWSQYKSDEKPHVYNGTIIELDIEGRERPVEGREIARVPRGRT